MTTFEAWMLVLAAAAIVISAGTSVWSAMFSVRRGDMDVLRTELGAKAAELVDAKFRTLAAEMESPVAVLSQIVKEMEKRMDWGEDKFVSDGDRLHKVELQCRQTSADTKAWALEHFATHSQLAGVAKELQKIQVALARCEEKFRMKETA